jgi:hypothetical protein
MGIDTSWKKVLAEWYPEAWLLTVPPNQRVNVLLDDLPVNVRKFTSGATRGVQIRKKFKDRLEKLQLNCDNLKYYIAIIDEPRFVPDAKQATQRKRSEKEKPFTTEDLKKFSFKVTDGVVPDMARLMATRSLQPEVYRYLTEILMANPLSDKNLPVRIDIDGGVVWKDRDGEMLLEPSYIISEPCQPVAIYEASRFGEADVKIAKHIARNNKNDVFYVCSYDTDLIPILLLAARDWIDEDEYINRKVYLDTDHRGHAIFHRGLDKDNPNHISPALKRTKAKASEDKAEVGKPEEPEEPRKHLVDIICLWRSILTDFKTAFPSVKDPIEVMTLMMVMTGTDFVERLPGFGAATMMNAFAVIGCKLMYAEDPILRKDRKDPRDSNPEEPWDVPHPIILAEHKIYQWIVGVYYYILFQDAPEDMSIFGFEKIEPDKRGVPGRCKLDMTMASLRKMPLKTGEIPSDMALMAYSRRVFWNMDYWSNGWKVCGYKNPTDVHPESGHSLYGWKAEDEYVEGVKRRKITAAEIIHR